MRAAEYAKLPLIPPFLEPSVDYSNGVNFASGGAGVLPETNQGLVRIQSVTKNRRLCSLERTACEFT